MVRLVRFQKVQVQVPGEVPEGFGANTFCGPVQIPGEVPQGSGADSR